MRDQRTPHGQRPDDFPETAPNLAPPPGNPRFPLFDSLRAIAALSVFLGHTVTGTYAFAQHRTLFLLAATVADQGVAIFFLISGFLLYRPFLAARRAGGTLAVRDFARRRILRIVPAYWVALTLFILAGFVSGVTSHNWWIFYGFGQVYSLNTIGHGIAAAWTLCIEVTFYAALPMFAFAAARFGGRRQSVRGDIVLLVILAAASLAFRAHFNSFSSYATVRTLPGTFCWFALGMALAIASATEEGRIEGSYLTRFVAKHSTLCWGAAVGAFVLLYEVSRSSQAVGANLSTHVLYGLVALFVLLPGVFGDTAGGLARQILRLPALAWIGLISYAFYLYHTIVIAQLAKIAANEHVPHRYLGVFLISFLVSCACAACSYYVLERPLMRLKRLSLVTHGHGRWRQPRSQPTAEHTNPPRGAPLRQVPDDQLAAARTKGGSQASREPRSPS